MLILTGIAGPVVSGQRKLSGNLSVKQPSTHVNVFGGAGTNWVKVDDITGFMANDTILMIQMQGVGILGTDPGDYLSYGIPQTEAYGKPGEHEFLIIQSISLPDQLIFKNNIINSFDVNGNIQVVRVPYCKSAIVESTLTVDGWDPFSKKGGVLAIIVSGYLKLNADIDVSGKGFRGGLDASGPGTCRDVASTNLPLYTVSETNAGFKGEGAAIHDNLGVSLLSSAVKGEGPNFTGGGGANGKYSGGGGGSNRGKGGTGGREAGPCFPARPGGWGGNKVDPAFFGNERIFFGGGAGASTSPLGASGARGGNGGGIVIIVTDTIIPNGGRILANGESGLGPSSAGGSGGGGGGGSIAITSTYPGVNELKIFAAGGNGGNNVNGYGYGGGGGGGLIFLNKPAAANFTTSVAPGLKGGTNANDGLAGQKVETFSAVLNGFLFNSIQSSRTGTLTDSVCSDTKPPVLTGTKPIGGKSPYTYKWQKSYDGTTWVDLVIDNVSVNYTPVVIETNPKVFFRRVVTDDLGLIDISLPVEFKVQPFIKNNTIGSDQTICYAQNPNAIVPTAVIADGNGIFAYKWEVSTDNITFANPANTNNTASYTPVPALTISSWYRRTVNSGRCIDRSAPVHVTVLDTIQKNKILNLPPEICFGMTFDNLQGTTPSTTTVLAGGDNTYKYLWEEKINGAATWTAASGINNLADYNPAELPSRAPYNEYLYRRVVYSGPADVCSSTSNAVTLKDFPVITNNTISVPQVLCSGSTPSKLIGSVPANGNGTYQYTWQDLSKTHTWTDIPGAIKISTTDYQPPALTDTTIYRRIVYSSACQDISPAIKMVVHKPILNNNITLSGGLTDTIICFNQVPRKLKGTLPTGGTLLNDFTYQWLYSTDNITYIPVPSAGTLATYQPPALTSTTYYRRQVASGACTVISSMTITVTVLPALTNAITGDQTICYNTVPAVLANQTLTGGNGTYIFLWEQSSDGGTIWSAASGTNNQSTYQPAALTIPMKYRRNVTSGFGGCCTAISNIVTVSIHPPLPTGRIVNIADTTICGGSDVLLRLNLTGTGTLKVTYRENSTDIIAANTTAGRTVITRKPASSAALDVYNYSLVKVEDGNGCLATSLTGAKKANVYRVPVAEAGPVQIVCGPKVTMAAVPSYGSGTWSFLFPSAQVVGSTTNAPGMSFTLDSTIFVNGIMTKRFYWEETNWQCKGKDSVDITFYKRPSNIFAGNDTTLYSFDQVFHLKNRPPSAWEEGFWSLESGSGDVSGTLISGLSDGSNSFLWKIRNRMDACSITDLLVITVSKVEVAQGISPNGDDVNDSLIIRGLDLVNQDVEFTVMNSAGAKVFSASSSSGDTSNWRSWDGKTSGGAELPEGTYFYLLKMVSRNEGAAGTTELRKGYIVLKRK